MLYMRNIGCILLCVMYGVIYRVLFVVYAMWCGVHDALYATRRVMYCMCHHACCVCGGVRCA